MERATQAEIAIEPDTEPVVMPELPPTLAITTLEQFKAISEPVRARILGIIQHQPATAKQIADRLHASPGTIGHHLHVLHEAGLVQIVARRLVRGIVANYYTRSARIFVFDLPKEIRGDGDVGLDMLKQAHDEMAALSPAVSKSADCSVSFLHVRLNEARMREFQERIEQLLADVIQEPPSEDGHVYGLSVAFFQAPDYVQPQSPAGDMAE